LAGWLMLCGRAARVGVSEIATATSRWSLSASFWRV
jgi:hypothetical protein